MHLYLEISTDISAYYFEKRRNMMANTVKKMLFGPYVGFFFNGHHSAEFGICRVSDGDRYTITIAPTSKDITTDR